MPTMLAERTAKVILIKKSVLEESFGKSPFGPSKSQVVWVSAESLASSWFDESVRELDAFQALPRDWDSYESDPISPGAVGKAKNLLMEVFSRYPQMKARPFAIAPMNGGGIQLEWRNPRTDIEVEIDPSGHLAYLLIERNNKERTVRQGHDAPFGLIMMMILQTIVS